VKQFKFGISYILSLDKLSTFKLYWKE